MISYGQRRQWTDCADAQPDLSHVWLAANHYTSVTSIARQSELDSCQSNMCQSRGYKRFKKSKDPLRACFENANSDK